MTKKSKIPIIDLFAGPGGLGEGFMSVSDQKGHSMFDLKLSIEKDSNAHETLELRSFFRQFRKGLVPASYYEMMRETNLSKRASLKSAMYEHYQAEYKKASKEAWQAELGSDNFPPELIDSRINSQLSGAKNWVLIGGPPCQAYSLVGRSRRQWKENLDKEDKRVHLYKEYLRIIAKHHPTVFVMENVKGLLSAKVDGEKVFDWMKRDLANPASVFSDLDSPKYKVYSLVAKHEGIKNGQPQYKSDSEYLIRAENYEVPQRRHRVILLGIREDIKTEPGILTNKNEQTNLQDVIGDLPKLRSGINRTFVGSEINDGKRKRYYKPELDTDSSWSKTVNDFRKEIISWNGFASKFGGLKINPPINGIGSEFVSCKTPLKKNPLFKWYYDPKLKGVANHESRTHLVQDLKRYMFSSMFTRTYKRFPRLHEYENHSVELLPDHENVRTGKFADRFRVQLPDQPATTVTSHISKDGHYFIHYDADQCRSLTVREAARIQTFPDNYLFCGSRTAQYHQVGNAVPPYLAKQIAEIVLKLFQDKTLNDVIK